MCRENQLEDALLEYIELYGLTANARELFCKENVINNKNSPIGEVGDQLCRAASVKHELD